MAKRTKEPTREELRADAMARRPLIVKSANGDLPIFGGIGSGGVGSNPAEYLRTIRPKTSTTDALGLYYVQDQDLYNLLDEMILRDATLAGAESALADFASEFPTLFEVVGDEDDDRAVAVRDETQEAIQGVAPFDLGAARSAVRTAVHRHGFAVVQIFWGVDGGRVVPVSYRHEHPAQFAFTTDGEVLIRDASGVRLPPPRKFIAVQWPALYGNPFGASQIFPLAILYQVKKLALKGWVELSDKGNDPILVVKIPADVKDPATAQANAEEMLRNLSGTKGVAFALGETLESIARNSSGSSKSVSEAIVDWCDRAMVRAILGGELNFMSGSTQTGGFAQAKTHGDASSRRAKTMAEIDERFVQQVVNHFVALNYGDDAAVRVCVDTEDAADVRTTEIRYRGALASGLAIKTEQAYREWGFELPQDDDEILVAPAPAAPSPFPPAEGEDDGDESEDRED